MFEVYDLRLVYRFGIWMYTWVACVGYVCVFLSTCKVGIKLLVENWSLSLSYLHHKLWNNMFNCCHTFYTSTRMNCFITVAKHNYFSRLYRYPLNPLYPLTTLLIQPSSTHLHSPQAFSIFTLFLHIPPATLSTTFHSHSVPFPHLSHTSHARGKSYHCLSEECIILMIIIIIIFLTTVI